jgi:hypothetical protein
MPSLCTTLQAYPRSVSGLYDFNAVAAHEFHHFLITGIRFEVIIFLIALFTDKPAHRKILRDVKRRPSYCEGFRLKIYGLLAGAADARGKRGGIGKLRPVTELVLLDYSP